MESWEHNDKNFTKHQIFKMLENKTKEAVNAKDTIDKLIAEVETLQKKLHEYQKIVEIINPTTP